MLITLLVDPDTLIVVEDMSTPSKVYAEKDLLLTRPAYTGWPFVIPLYR